MPIISDDLILALNDKKYQYALSLIKANGDLVNCLDKEGFSPLQILLMQVGPQDKLPELVEFIVTHPLFKLNDLVEGQLESNLETIILSARMDLLFLIKDRPQIVGTEKQLSYALAAEDLVTAKKSLKIVQDQLKDQKKIDRAISRVNNLEKVVSLIRDASILHAIKTDNHSLMDALQKAGARPTENLGALGKNAVPASLLNQATNKQLLAWFNAQAVAQQHAEQRAKSAPASIPAARYVTALSVNGAAGKSAPALTPKPVTATSVNGPVTKSAPVPTIKPIPATSAAVTKSGPAPIAQPVPASGAAKQAPNYSAMIGNMGLLVELERQQRQLEADHNKARAKLYIEATNKNLGVLNSLIAGAKGYN